MFDFMQFVFCLILVNVTFPPNLLYSIRSSMVSVFTFLPNYFSSVYKDASFEKGSNTNNIYSLMQDGSFLRVLGPFYFIMTMLVIFILVVLIFSKKAPNKDTKRWSKSFLR